MKLILSIILILLFIETSDAEFIVKTIYFQPTDAPNIQDARDKIRKSMLETQELYANELDRHGFGLKTFDLEEDNNGLVVVHHVVGKHDGNHYVDNTWDKLKPELPNQFIQSTSPWNKQDMVFVIVVGGVEYVNSIRWGIGWPRHSNRYGGVTYMAGGSPHFDKNLVFHEIGHCFGLYHNENSVSGRLEHYEARWLSEHYHFNEDTNNFTYPKPVSTNPSLTNRDENKVRFELDVTSNVGLHQAQVFRKSDIIMLDWDYLDGSREDTVTFEVNKNKWSDTVVLQIMDVRGNYHMVDISIILPKQTKPKNPEDIDKTDIEIPDVVKKSTDDNVVYLTIIDGDTPLPNENGLKPYNPAAQYKNGWKPENITDNATTHRKPISVQGSLFERGISLTPPDHPDSSVLQYDLSGNDYTQFQAYIGMTDDHKDNVNNNANESCNVGGSSIFIFHIDNKPIFESDVMTGTMKAQYIEFDIPNNAKVLSVTFNSSLDGNWCDNPAVGDPKLIVEGSVNTSKQIDVSPNGKLTTKWASIKYTPR